MSDPFVNVEVAKVSAPRQVYLEFPQRDGSTMAFGPLTAVQVLDPVLRTDVLFVRDQANNGHTFVRAGTGEKAAEFWWSPLHQVWVREVRDTGGTGPN